MIKIVDKWVNPANIVSAEVETRLYINGTASWLVVKLSDGSVIRHEHGWGFDAWKALDKITSATI